MLFATNGARQLHGQMTRTYFSLRLGLGIIALLLPGVLWLGDALAERAPLRCSISAYYYSPMRDVFVGALVAIGTFLFLYKGFNAKENRALKAAGAFAIGIAMVPTDGLCRAVFPAISAHGVFAVLFFVSVAYVCVFRAPDTLVLVRDARIARRFRIAYRLFGAALLLTPLAAALLVYASHGRRGHIVFFVESFAVVVFALFWLTKSHEFEITDSTLLAGQLTLHGGRAGRGGTAARRRASGPHEVSAVPGAS